MHWISEGRNSGLCKMVRMVSPKSEEVCIIPQAHCESIGVKENLPNFYYYIFQLNIWNNFKKITM